MNHLHVVKVAVLNLVAQSFWHDGQKDLLRFGHSWRILVLVCEHGTRVEGKKSQIPLFQAHVDVCQSGPCTELAWCRHNASLRNLQGQIATTFGVAEVGLAVEQRIVHGQLLDDLM